MRKMGNQSSSIIGPPIVPFKSEIYKHLAIPILHITSGIFILLERKFISIASDIDETSAEDKQLQTSCREELETLLETECHLLDQQKDLGEQWLDNKNIADAFLQSKNLDPDRENKCDAETCILDQASTEIQWVECTGASHDKGKFYLYNFDYRQISICLNQRFGAL